MNTFDPKSDNVISWLKKFDFFRVSSKLSENVTETMLHYLDQRTRKLVEAGMGTDNINLADLDRLELARNQLKSLYQREEPTPSEFRDKFSARNQEQGESANLYAAELKRLAMKAYSTLPEAVREEYVRDKFINGLINSAIRSKLLFDAPASLNTTVATVKQWESVENKNKRQEHPATLPTTSRNNFGADPATSMIYPVSSPAYTPPQYHNNNLSKQTPVPRHHANQQFQQGQQQQQFIPPPQTPQQHQMQHGQPGPSH
jgi:hypothetical protein